MKKYTSDLYRIEQMQMVKRISSSLQDSRFSNGLESLVCCGCFFFSHRAFNEIVCAQKHFRALSKHTKMTMTATTQTDFKDRDGERKETKKKQLDRNVCKCRRC